MSPLSAIKNYFERHEKFYVFLNLKMAAVDTAGDESLYPIAVLIDELRNEDIQVHVYILTNIMFK